MIHFFFFFFFNDTATTEIYTLSLHDALPISFWGGSGICNSKATRSFLPPTKPSTDRKSTRLNSSHTVISYAVFCLKKKKKKKKRSISNSMTQMMRDTQYITSQNSTPYRDMRL